MSNLVVNQCEYGCGVVGHWDVGKQEQVGEELEEHYKKCPIKEKWGDKALEQDYKELEKNDVSLGADK